MMDQVEACGDCGSGAVNSNYAKEVEEDVVGSDLAAKLCLESWQQSGNWRRKSLTATGSSMPELGRMKSRGGLYGSRRTWRGRRRRL